MGTCWGPLACSPALSHRVDPLSQVPGVCAPGQSPRLRRPWCARGPVTARGPALWTGSRERERERAGEREKVGSAVRVIRGSGGPTLQLPAPPFPAEGGCKGPLTSIVTITLRSRTTSCERPGASDPGEASPHLPRRRLPSAGQLPVKFVWTSGGANKDKAWVFLEAIG